MPKDYRTSTRRLAVALAALAAVDLLPILVAFARSGELHRWMLVLSCLVATTGAMSVLLYQVTDWSTSRAIAWFTAAITLVFAASTAIGLFANGTNRLVIGLDLTRPLQNRWLAIWSIFQLICFAAITFALERVSNRSSAT